MSPYKYYREIDLTTMQWVLPEIPNSQTGTTKPTRIYYPHFSTSEIHDNMVDWYAFHSLLYPPSPTQKTNPSSVAFHNDLILSKADKSDFPSPTNTIVLWCISGFSSHNTPPPPASAPTAHDQNRDTRSAFTPPGTQPYTRLAQLAIPDSNLMFSRFGVFDGLEGKGPVVAWCNEASKVFFWDLKRLEEYWEYISALQSAVEGGGMGETAAENIATEAAGAPKRPPFLIHFKPRVRGGAARPTTTHTHSHRMRDASPSESDRSTPSNLAPVASAASAPTTGGASINPDTNTSTTTNATTNGPSNGPSNASNAPPYLQKSRETWGNRYGIEDMQRPLKAHREEGIRNFAFVGRRVAWSRGGEWCVVVGSLGVMAVFERWEKDKVKG